MYGSMSTGLALEISDVDIALQSLSIDSKEKHKDMIIKFSVELAKLPYVEDCQYILTARVPVIKLV